MTTKQSGTYFPAGVVEEFLPRIGRVVEIKGHQLAVFRASDGTIFAADNHTPTLRVAAGRRHRVRALSVRSAV